MSRRCWSKKWFSLIGALGIFCMAVSADTAQAAGDGDAAPGPIAVLHSASYDRWHDNVELIGTIAGSPDLAQGLEAMLKIATANRGLAGLDKTRHWAVIVAPRGPSFTPYACLPIDQLDALIEVVRPLTDGIIQQDNIYVIRLKNGVTIRTAQRGRWAVVALDADTIAQAAADPTPLLGELPKRYDLALKLNITRLPQAFRTIVLARFAQYAAADRRTDETNTQYLLRQRRNRLAAEAIYTGFDELDSVTLGLTITQTTNRLAAELTLVAKPDTSLAQRFSQFKKRPSQLAGFRLADAALTANLSLTPSQAGVDRLRLLIDAAEAAACRQLDRPGPEKGLGAVKNMVHQFCKQIQSRLAPGQPLDAAVSVVLDPQLGATWVSAVRLPENDDAFWKMATQFERIGKGDGTAWSNLIRKTDPDGQFVMNVTTVQFNGKLSAREKPLDWFLYPTQWGPRLEVTVGAGKSNAYLAFGDNATRSLIQAINSTRPVSSKATAPLQCSMALTPMAQLVATSAKGPIKARASLVAKALKELAGNDHVRLTGEPVDRGLRLRVELDQGVIRALGLTANMFSANQQTAEPDQ